MTNVKHDHFFTAKIDIFSSLYGANYNSNVQKKICYCFSCIALNDKAGHQLRQDSFFMGFEGKIPSVLFCPFKVQIKTLFYG